MARAMRRAIRLAAIVVLVICSGVVQPARPAFAAASGACPFYLTASWNGSLPGGCYKNYYLLFTGAMAWNGQGGFCPWDLIAPIGGTHINECTVATNLINLGTTLHNMNPGASFTLLAGTNDCVLNYGGHSIGEAASSLNGILNYVFNNTPAGIGVLSEMDAEGYGANGSCFNASSSLSGNSLSFFQSYYAAGGSARWIGPGGAAPLTASNEYTLWLTGGGYLIPQIYAPGNQYNWPTQASGYYWFLQTYPVGGGYFANDCDANSAFAAYIGQYPLFDLD